VNGTDTSRKANVKTVSYSLYAMQALRGRRYSSYSILTSVLDGGEWSASRPGHALPLAKDLQYPLEWRMG
jgi:hypothetical protein